MRHRVGILTALWKRHDVARAVLSYYDSLSHDRIVLVPLAVGSEGEASADLAYDCGWDYLEYPNDPLGSKLNAGMAAMQTADVCGVVIIGSDDLLSTQYFDALADALDEGADTFHVRHCYFYDLSTGRMAVGPHWHPGAGRFLSSAALTAASWMPWDGSRNRLLDGSMNEAMRYGKSRWDGDYRRSGVVVLDVKSATNIWDYDECMLRGGGCLPVDADMVWSVFPPEVREALTPANQ